MILDLVKETNQELRKFTRLRSQELQKEDIENTFNEICKLQNSLNQLLEGYKLKSKFLPEEISQSIKNALQSVKALLDESKIDLLENENYKQSPVLGSIQTNIKNARENIQRAWMLFVQSQISPYKELAHIADTLPAMKNDLSQIMGLIDFFGRLEQKQPTMDTWHQFETKKNQLSRLLDNLKGLDEDKRNFLNKIRAKRAVLTDLTPELLEWCVQQGIAASLGVRFIDRA